MRHSFILTSLFSLILLPLACGEPSPDPQEDSGGAQNSSGGSVNGSSGGRKGSDPGNEGGADNDSTGSGGRKGSGGGSGDGSGGEANSECDFPDVTACYRVQSEISGPAPYCNNETGDAPQLLNLADLIKSYANNPSFSSDSGTTDCQQIFRNPSDSIPFIESTFDVDDTGYRNLRSERIDDGKVKFTCYRHYTYTPLPSETSCSPR